jgi:hypothetical protein
MRRIYIETSERGSKSNIVLLKPLGLDTFSPNYRRKHSTSAYVFQKKCEHIYESSLIYTYIYISITTMIYVREALSLLSLG